MTGPRWNAVLLEPGDHVIVSKVSQSPSCVAGRNSHQGTQGWLPATVLHSAVLRLSQVSIPVPTLTLLNFLLALVLVVDFCQRCERLEGTSPLQATGFCMWDI